MKQKIVQIGNSEGIIIPAELRKELKIKKGSDIYIDMATDNESLIISKTNSHKKTSTITPRFLNILDGVNKRYGPALAKLAKQ